MVTKRFGYLDDFTLKNTKVGIGTSTANEKLEVLGGSRSQDIAVTGIATLTSYEGFQNKKTSYVENISINSGESGTLSGEVVIGAGLTMSVGTGATTGQGSIKSLKVSNTFTPPIGVTADRPSAPKPGALYYNKDFRTIEYWDGSFWRQVNNRTTSGRQVTFSGHDTAARVNRIEFLNGSTGGVAQYFGDQTNAVWQGIACSNETRGLTAGGSTPTHMNTIEYITIASTGNAIDFGDLTQGSSGGCGSSSSTRGIWRIGGQGGGYVNSIEYVQINTLGNSIDFGDCTKVTSGSGGACQSPTRCLFMGGYTSPSLIEISDIQSIQTASRGNAVTFGHLTNARSHNYAGSNSVRGICAGGTTYDPSNPDVDTIDYVTIASFGNAIDFGSLTSKRGYMAGRGSATQTRAIIWAGRVAPAGFGGGFNRIESVNFATTGNSFDFGECSLLGYSSSASDSHGGLGGF